MDAARHLRHRRSEVECDSVGWRPDPEHDQFVPVRWAGTGDHRHLSRRHVRHDLRRKPGETGEPQSQRDRRERRTGDGDLLVQRYTLTTTLGKPANRPGKTGPIRISVLTTGPC